MPDDVQSLMYSAVRMLALREHSRRELRQKLERRAASELVEQVLDCLQEQGLQSDERFVHSFVRSRVEKGYGPVRIRAELRERGIEDSLADEALVDYATQWPDLLRILAERRFGLERPLERRQLAKQARYLSSRGFPADLVYRCLNDDQSF